MIHYSTLLQNATDVITKNDSYFIIKCDKNLLQNAPGFLLQIATVLLQNVKVITNYDDSITKCNICYKMRRLLQIATVRRALSFIFSYFFMVLKGHFSIFDSLFNQSINQSH